MYHEFFTRILYQNFISKFEIGIALRGRGSIASGSSPINDTIISIDIELILSYYWQEWLVMSYFTIQLYEL